MLSTSVVHLSRYAVVDRDFSVLLAGTSEDDLVPAPDGMELSDSTARELKAIVAGHDFATRPVACALVDSDQALRVTRHTGPAGAYYGVSSQRTGFAAMLRRAVIRYALSEDDLAGLRFDVGGYGVGQIVALTGEAAELVRDRTAHIRQKLDCETRADVLDVIAAKTPAASRRLARQA